MTAGITPRRDHTSKTTLNDNPLRVANVEEAVAEQWDARDPLPVEGQTTGRRLALTWAPVSRHLEAPLHLGLSRTEPNREPACGLRGSAAPFTLVIPTPTTNTMRWGKFFEATGSITLVVQGGPGCRKS